MKIPNEVLNRWFWTFECRKWNLVFFVNNINKDGSNDVPFYLNIGWGFLRDKLATGFHFHFGILERNISGGGKFGHGFTLFVRPDRRFTK